MNEKDKMKRWAEAWKSAAVELKKIKQKELAETNIDTALNNLSDAFEYAIKNSSPRPTSGLVEQQMYFKKLRNK